MGMVTLPIKHVTVAMVGARKKLGTPNTHLRGGCWKSAQSPETIEKFVKPPKNSF